MSSPAAPGNLSALSCTSLTACTADGYTGPDKRKAPLAERWDGTSWAIQHTPAPPGGVSSTLTGVSCASGSSCTAAGWYKTEDGAAKALAEGWNGSSWAVQSVPNNTLRTAGTFRGVSCAGPASCVAVGIYRSSRFGDQALLAEAWNGTTWAPIPGRQQVPSSTLQELTSVSCPSTSMCMTVGEFGVSRPLAEMWNGNRWTVVAPPEPPGKVQFLNLNSVSCASTTSCVAVGDVARHGLTTATLAYAWNGTAWRMLPMPAVSEGELTAVSCASLAGCTAVGTDAASGMPWLAEAWNGTSWKVQSVPGTRRVDMSAVSCTSATACTAVGGPFDTALKHRTQLVAERWDGTQWTIQKPAAAPANAEFTEFNGVSCASASACTAVGDWVSKTAVGPGVLVQKWNGSTWTAQQAPESAAHSDAALYAASCTSSTACTAVGDTGDEATPKPLAERSG
jgi:hypothetical protein